MTIPVKFSNSMFLITSFFPFLIIVANLALGVFVFIKNPKRSVNRVFFAIAASITLWNLSIFMIARTSDPNLIFFWRKNAYMSASLIPALFWFFVSIFPRGLKIISIQKWVLFFAPIFIFPFLIFINQVVGKASHAPWHKPGNAYPFLFIYILGYFIASFIELFNKYKQAEGTSKLQLGYLSLGFFLSVIVAIFTNLILPSLGILSFNWVGPSASIIMVSMISYAVLKHRLMSIEVVIQRGTIYTVVTILIMAFYALAVIVSELFLRNIIGYTSLIITAAAALLIAVAYQPLVRIFQTLTDRFFFRGRYDYQKTLQEISQKIASFIKLEELTRLIISTFIETMKISEISFLLLDTERRRFRSIPINLKEEIGRYKKIEIDESNPIISWLSATRDVLVQDELEGKVEEKDLAEVKEEMERLGVIVWVPIISKDKLIGIITLGSKLSGDVFTSEDIGLLTTLASQTAVALDNARLYEEVVLVKNYSEEILQSMTNGVLTVDLKGKIITFNNMAKTITGFEPIAIIGKTLVEVWGENGFLNKIAKETLQGRRYFNFEGSVVSVQKGLVPISVSSTLLKDSQGRKIGALITFSDLTEVKVLEDRVRQADKLAALGTMAAGMAHEIKNPLSSMKILSQLLPLKFQDEDYRKKFLEIMPREINRVDRIVESLLGFARATAPQFQLTNLQALLEETLEYFSAQIKDKKIKLITHYIPIAEVMTDPEQLSQAFSNLILNAIQAMHNGGELAVSFRKNKSNLVCVDIADTGHGISQEIINKLFDPFYTTKYGGTGLGLTITHSIIEGHGGTIEVKSEVGKGTTFTVTLPLGSKEEIG